MKNKAVTILATAAILILPGGISILLGSYILKKVLTKKS